MGAVGGDAGMLLIRDKEMSLVRFVMVPLPPPFPPLQRGGREVDGGRTCPIGPLGWEREAGREAGGWRLEGGAEIRPNWSNERPNRVETENRVETDHQIQSPGNESR